MKAKLMILGAFGLLVALLLVTRAVHQAKSDLLQNPYTGVVTVNAIVAKPQSFPRIIQESGVLVGVKESVISAQTGGQIIQMMVDVGDRVRAGDPILRVDDELFKLEAGRAKNAYEKTKLDYERMQRLQKQNSVSEAELEGMRLAMEGAEVGYRMAQKTFEDATIKAPFSGVVSQRFTEVGQMIERSMPAIQLVDISQLKLTINITEDQIRYVSNGGDVIVTVDAVGDSIKGRINAIGSKSAAGARTFPVEIRIPGNEKLKSGMFARASIEAGMIPDVFIIPRVAIVPESGKMTVYLSRNNIAAKVFIEVVGSKGDHVAINGIQEGDIVLTNGNQGVAIGTSLTVKIETDAAQ